MFDTLLPLGVSGFSPLNAELNPISRMLAFLGAHHILHVSRIRVTAWHGVDHPPPPSAEVKVRIELYHTPPLGLHGVFETELPLFWDGGLRK